MSKYIIKGGNKLNGVLKIDCCKNAILPILAASILCKGKVVVKNCARYSDVLKMIKILKKLGSCTIFRKNVLVIDNSNLQFCFIDNSLTKDIRASIFTLGPMLARFKKAKIAYPGGCAIGQRGIDIHIANFKKLGVKILERHGFLYGEVKGVESNDLRLEFPSVGATENLMMFLCLCKGESFRIFNAAKEPEIVDLANFLNKMGAKVSGAGTDEIDIVGVERLVGVEYEPIEDRIVAGTLLIAVAMVGGKVRLENCNYERVRALCEVLDRIGCNLAWGKDFVEIESGGKLNSFGRVDTRPYPLFPTDLQPQLTVLATILKGVSVIRENIFECRFRFVDEIVKMGAKVQVVNNMAIVEGVEYLFGAEVYAYDLRGGAALVIAGLKAKGYTTVNNVEFIDRGYFRFEEQLRKLGVDIIRVKG